MVSPSDYLASLRLKVFLRALSRTDLPWTGFVKGLLSSCTGKWNLGLEELLCSCFPHHKTDLPDFWKECLRDWQRLWLNSSKIDHDSLLTQSLFNNPHIKPRNRPLSNTKWFERREKGLRTLGDLWKDGKMEKPFIQELRRERGITIRNKTRLMLIESIPASWVTSLRQGLGKEQRKRLNLSRCDHTSG